MVIRDALFIISGQSKLLPLGLHWNHGGAKPMDEKPLAKI